MTDSDGEWFRAAYHEAEEDIRWAKQRGTSVTYWSVLLIVGVVAAASNSTIPEPYVLLYVAPLLGAVVVAWWWLTDLHGFAADARTSVDSLLKRFPPGSKYPRSRARRASRRDHLCHLWTQRAVVVAAGVFALVEIAVGTFRS